MYILFIILQFYVQFHGDSNVPYNQINDISNFYTFYIVVGQFQVHFTPSIKY